VSPQSVLARFFLLFSPLVSVGSARGDEEMVERCRSVAAALRQSSYGDQRVSAQIVLARDALERGAPAEALDLVRDVSQEEGLSGESVELSYALAVEAAMSLDEEEAISRLVETVADAQRVEVPDEERVAYATQTTLSLDEARDIIEALRRKFPNINGPHAQDICYATENRQVAVKHVASDA